MLLSLRGRAAASAPMARQRQRFPHVPARAALPLPAAAAAAASASGSPAVACRRRLRRAPPPPTRAAASTSSSSSSSSSLDPADAAAWLRQCAAFSQLTPESLRLFAGLLREESASTGQRLDRAGDAATRVLVVRQGTVRVSVPRGGGGSSATTEDDNEEDDDLLEMDDEAATAGPLSSGSSRGLKRPSFAASARAGPGAVLNLSAVLLAQASPSDVRAESPVVLWTASAEDVRNLARHHPEVALELGLRLSQALSASLSEAEAELEAEQVRQRVLAPFRVAQPRAGVVGTSRYADALRKSIVASARDRDRRPVFLFGEPGLHKDDLAALVHFGGGDRARPLVRVDCARFAAGAPDDLEGGGLLLELFGRGSRGGLLYHLRDGSLLLSNVHRLPAGALPALAELVRNGSYQPLPALAALAASTGAGPAGAAGAAAGGSARAVAPAVTLSSLDLLAPPPRRSPARIIMTASRQVPILTAAINAALSRREAATGAGPTANEPTAAPAKTAGGKPAPAPPRVITVPPLRVRRADVLDIARYQLRLLERLSGDRLALSSEAAGRLEAYAWPDNAEEVEAVVGRAVQQATVLSSSASASDSSSSSAAAAASSRPTSPLAFLGSSSQKQQQQRPIIVLEPELFWGVAEKRDRLRLNLLSSVAGLRALFRSRLWPDLLVAYVVRPLFAAVVLVLFVGPQTRDANAALAIFWDGWWPIMFISYLVAGRWWCSICPFSAYGDLAQLLRVKLQGHEALLRWPREQMERWGGWFMLSLFFAILVWEEAWDLPNTAALSSWLLLLITFGSIVGSWFFERRVWCRYLCPIGAMNGAFAKLSMTEVRAKQGVCSGSCSTYGCFKGQGSPEQWWSPLEPGRAVPVVVAPEGLADPGCPVGSHPAQLTDNRACVLCMQCLKACPHRSVEFRFRPPAIDLWASVGARHQALAWESSMLMMLLGAVYLHRLPQMTMQVLGGGFGGGGASLEEAGAMAAAPLEAVSSAASTVASAADPFFLAAPLKPLFEFWMAHRPEHIAASSLILVTPGLLAWGVDLGQRAWSAAVQQQQRVPASSAAEGGAAALAVLPSSSSPSQPVAPLPSFLELSYSYMPLTWAATLAHYEEQMLRELGHLLPLAARTAGGLWGLEERLWSVEAHPAVVAFVQGATLALGLASTLALTRRIAARPWAEIAPQCLFSIALTAELWALMI